MESIDAPSGQVEEANEVVSKLVEGADPLFVRS